MMVLEAKSKRLKLIKGDEKRYIGSLMLHKMGMSVNLGSDMLDSGPMGRTRS